jgi:hypothetical protein
VYPVNSPYCCSIVFVSGPRNTRRSRVPDSEIQCVWDDFGEEEKLRGFDFWVFWTSIQVSAALSQRIAASLPPLEDLRWACINGIAP